MYSVAVAALPGGRGDGQPITSLIELETGTQPAHYFAGSAEHTLLLANTGGFGLLAKAQDMQSRQRAGKSFLSARARGPLAAAGGGGGRSRPAGLPVDERRGCWSSRSTR